MVKFGDQTLNFHQSMQIGLGQTTEQLCPERLFVLFYKKVQDKTFH